MSGQCHPTDSSPPGSPVHGILQARTLKWVTSSFSIPCGSSYISRKHLLPAEFYSWLEHKEHNSILAVYTWKNWVSESLGYFPMVMYLVRSWLGYLKKNCWIWNRVFYVQPEGNVTFIPVRKKLEYSYSATCFKISSPLLFDKSLKYFIIWFTNWHWVKRNT